MRETALKSLPMADCCVLPREGLWYLHLKEFERYKLRVMISMVLCNVIVVEYDRRRSGLSSAPLSMKYDSNRTEIKPYL